MSAPRLLDLFCCQGGSAYGYRKAGFDVVAVDIDPQPRFPVGPGLEFVQGDALAYLIAHGHEFDALAGPPPCQRFTNAQRIQGNAHPDFIGPMRQLVRALGVPYVIENVPGAPLVQPVELCGAMFGLHTYRHRLFEASFPITVPEHPVHAAETVKMGRPLREGDWYHAVGNFSNVGYVRRDLGVPWMNRDGIRECIPPVYARHIGAQLLEHLGAAERAA